jgi:sensor histidine kinase YesM
MLDHMNRYLRATLSGSRATTHPLADEFARLDDYLALMAVRMGPRLGCTLDLPEALRDVPVPPLLLQPLVENAIRHGLEPKVDGGHITVRAASSHGNLLLEVVDTGVGFDASVPPPNAADSSFGLAQVRERVATAYEGRGRVELTSTPGRGTVIRIHLPLASLDP